MIASNAPSPPSEAAGAPIAPSRGSRDETFSSHLRQSTSGNREDRFSSRSSEGHESSVLARSRYGSGQPAAQDRSRNRPESESRESRDETETVVDPPTNSETAVQTARKLIAQAERPQPGQTASEAVEAGAETARKVIEAVAWPNRAEDKVIKAMAWPNRAEDNAAAASRFQDVKAGAVMGKFIEQARRPPGSATPPADSVSRTSSVEPRTGRRAGNAGESGEAAATLASLLRSGGSRPPVEAGELADTGPRRIQSHGDPIETGLGEEDRAGAKSSAPARTGANEESRPVSDQAAGKSSGTHPQNNLRPVENRVPVVSRAVENQEIAERPAKNVESANADIRPREVPPREFSGPPRHLPANASSARDVRFRAAAPTPISTRSALTDGLPGNTPSPANNPIKPVVLVQESHTSDYVQVTSERSSESFQAFAHDSRSAHEPGSAPPTTPRTAESAGRLAEEPTLPRSVPAERATTVSRKSEKWFQTVARLEIRPTRQPLAQPGPRSTPEYYGSKLPTSYPQNPDRAPSFVKGEPATPGSSAGPDSAPNSGLDHQLDERAAVGFGMRVWGRRNSAAQSSQPPGEAPAETPEEQKTSGGTRRGIQPRLARIPGSRGAAGNDSPAFKALEPAAAKSGAADSNSANSTGITTPGTDSRSAGGETNSFPSAAFKSPQGTFSAPETVAAESSSTERTEAVERLVEMAALQRKTDATQMNVLLRDSRLGRISLRFVERAGLIDTIVRGDNPRGAALISDNLWQLVESLTGRGLQASAGSPTNGQTSYGDSQQQNQGGQRRPRAPRPRPRDDRRITSFQLEVDRGAD